MKQKNEEIAHADNRNKAANRQISRQLLEFAMHSRRGGMAGGR